MKTSSGWHHIIFLIKNIFSFVLRTARNKWFCMSPDLTETGGVFSFALGAFLTCRERLCCQIPRWFRWLSQWKLPPAFFSSCEHRRILSHYTLHYIQSNLGSAEMLTLHFANRCFSQGSGALSRLLQEFISSVCIWGFCWDFIWRPKITGRVWRADYRKHTHAIWISILFFIFVFSLLYMRRVWRDWGVWGGVGKETQHFLCARLLCIYYIMCPTPMHLLHHAFFIASWEVGGIMTYLTDEKTELQQQRTPGSSLVSVTDFKEMTFVYHDLVLDGSNCSREKSISHKNCVLISLMDPERWFWDIGGLVKWNLNLFFFFWFCFKDFINLYVRERERERAGTGWREGHRERKKQTPCTAHCRAHPNSPRSRPEPKGDS